LQNSLLGRGSYELELDLKDYYCAPGFTPLNPACTMRFRKPDEDRYYRAICARDPCPPASPSLRAEKIV
jgi:hypothetical protein